MNDIIPLVLDTLSSAALIFFAAVGLTLVFNVLRVLNVAHGSFYSIGAYVAASICAFIASRHLNPYLSFVALLFSAALVAVVLSPLIESTLIRWTYGKSEAVQILITFGLFLILEDLQRMIFGVQSFYEDTPMRLMGSTSIGGVVYLNYQMFLVAMAVIEGNQKRSFWQICLAIEPGNQCSLVQGCIVGKEIVELARECVRRRTDEVRVAVKARALRIIDPMIHHNGKMRWQTTPQNSEHAYSMCKVEGTAGKGRLLSHPSPWGGRRSDCRWCQAYGSPKPLYQAACGHRSTSC